MLGRSRQPFIVLKVGSAVVDEFYSPMYTYATRLTAVSTQTNHQQETNHDRNRISA